MIGTPPRRRRRSMTEVMEELAGQPRTQVDARQFTWGELFGDVAKMGASAAWLTPELTRVVELADRVHLGWQRYYEALRDGELDAARRVMQKIVGLEAEASRLDGVARELLRYRALQQLRSLCGHDIAVSVRAERWSVDVQLDQP